MKMMPLRVDDRGCAAYELTPMARGGSSSARSAILFHFHVL
jgi:hypothetical protein